MGSRILRKCHSAAEPREINIMIEIIKKLKEGEVSGGGGWKAEGDKQEVKIFETKCDDSCFKAQGVMWDLMKHRLRDARRGDMEESVSVVRP